MNRNELENLLKDIKVKQERYYEEISEISKAKFLNKKVRFKNTSFVNDEPKDEVLSGLIEDVTITSDFDLMFQVKDVDDQTKIIFSHSVLGLEQ